MMEDELLAVISQTQRKRFVAGVITLTDLGWLVSLGRGKKIEPLLNEVAKDVQSSALPPERLPEVLRDALNNYLTDSYGSEEEIMKRISQRDIFPWVRRKQYPEEKNKLGITIKNQYDIEILLDAHDLSVAKELKALEFVTGDQEDIVGNGDTILSILRLSAIRSLSSF
jgi:hypothetical protein